MQHFINQVSRCIVLALRSALEEPGKRSGGDKEITRECPYLFSRFFTIAERAGDRIEIMAGGGVCAENAHGMVNRTGVTAVHVPALAKWEDCSIRAAEGERVRYGKDYPVIDHEPVRRVVAAL